MDELVTFPVPIREGLAAQVRVPHDLTKEEAEKIARVVVALARVDVSGATAAKEG